VSCCGSAAALSLDAGATQALHHGDRVDATFVRKVAPDRSHIDFLVPEMHCAGCISAIERVLGALPGVTVARANLTSHRVGVDFEAATGSPDAMLVAIEGLGYSARPFDAAIFDAANSDNTSKELVLAMAVAGFAAGNIMLLSVSVWSGATDATRDLFHWISALIALPAIAFAGRPFFRSAWRALSAGRMNMDVPITIGVILASAMSLFETATHGEHAWFDASIGLLFFLLVGRFLDHRMRDVARSAAARLLSLSARSAMRLDPDGTAIHVPIGEILPGDRVRVAAGERLPVDGTVLEGRSDVDRSMLTGEAEPEAVQAGEKVFAGTLNLTGPLEVQVTARTEATLLADIVRLMEAAEHSGSPFIRIADRASRLYAPVVHILAAATFLGWLMAGGGWHQALMACVAVLIITCPCALGLAVPAVQVVASGLLLRRGIMLKDGAALEKLAGVDTVVFDKTGTLTRGEPQLVEPPLVDVGIWAIAAALGGASRHPLARSLAEAAAQRGIAPASLKNVAERAGSGMEGEWKGEIVRLGRHEWVGGMDEDMNRSGRSEIWLRIGMARPVPFRFEDSLRSDAAATVTALKTAGLYVMLLSGDHSEAVASAVRRAGIDVWRAHCLPADKAAALTSMRAAGRRVLMVGDGINDAPALASADVSMSPASASDISQVAAGLVFTGERLEPVVTALKTARAARRTILQNIALAVVYNLFAVPIAMAGHATPLIAAVAMSTSSILVTANALRLPPRDKAQRPAAGRQGSDGMTGLLILIPAALLLGAAGLAAFLWSLRSGQFDDLDGAAVRILNDDPPSKKVGGTASTARGSPRSRA
jgi:Cu2+-exporting ATPase